MPAASTTSVTMMPVITNLSVDGDANYPESITFKLSNNTKNDRSTLLHTPDAKCDLTLDTGAPRENKREKT